MTEKKKDASTGADAREKGQTEEQVELDFGNLFRGLGGFVDMVGKLAEAGEKQVSRQGEFRVKGFDGQAKGVYGVSIRSGIGGETRPRVQPFGHVRTGTERTADPDIREALVDVFDECHEVVVTGELPGVSENEISVTLEESVLTISTVGEHPCVKRLDLPAAVDPESFEKSFNNGVLELRIAKRK